MHIYAQFEGRRLGNACRRATTWRVPILKLDHPKNPVIISKE